jgi:hypothetical protein
MFLVFQPSSLLSLDHRRTNTNATSRTANICSNIIDAYIIHQLRFFESMVIPIYISLTIRYITYSMNNHSFVIAVLISVNILIGSPIGKKVGSFCQEHQNRPVWSLFGLSSSVNRTQNQLPNQLPNILTELALVCKLGLIRPSMHTRTWYWS